MTRILPSENYFMQKCCFKNALLPVKLPSSFASFFHYSDCALGKYHDEMTSVEPIQIPNRKQKQSSLSDKFCRISFIPNHFNRNRKRNRFVPVIFESVTICDQNVTESVSPKKLKKIQSVWPRSQIWNCDILWPSQMSNIVCDLYKKLVSVSVWNPDWNDSKGRS